MTINERVRAILCPDHTHILLIKRTRPGQAPYWVFPGGGMEAEDANAEAALRRELREELGAEANILRLVLTLERQTASDVLTREHYFLCTVTSVDLSNRTGPEFDDPTRGGYDVETIDFDAATLLNTDIKPPELKEWLAQSALRIFEPAPTVELRVS